MFNEEKKPLYMQIFEYYKQKINNKELLPNDQLPTEIEMAEMFGVSRITTKRALEELEREGFIYRKRGQGSFVSDLHQRKINESNRKNVISMIIPATTMRGRNMDYVKGATDVINQKGYYLALHITENETQEREMLMNIPKDGISGIIFYPISRAHFDLLYIMHITGYPIVTIDKHFESLPISYVICDNFNGAYQSVSHLVELGHKNIAYIASSTIESISTVRQRFFGYCSALQEHNLKIEREFVVLGLADQVKHFKDEMEKTNFLKAKLERLLKKGVTAIIAENDYIAVSIQKILIDMGVKIPKEVSLIGFDNLDVLEQVGIMLTTVEQNFYEIGKAAADIIIEMLENGKREQIKRVVPVKLVIKESTGPCNTVK
ncbi:GntR family transcriptional regulator [Caldicoprobacter faecalis]|uniref:DNA-binding transcriptional regulator, LacI/PurR family n=1 Tax=Caldicoprobacter faecalis TaxID=937334 RepID=A0A1I5SCE5_9FIRM|nr:GntR family transcriptional regulator [Caldicoprobacter faecalis]SFP68405.1 DNA-binding transcriptional regulator, LacI/PurR family [Caldicoprobacter faecalis]